MVKIILALLVIMIIVLVANGLGVVNEGFIQCSEKSSYSFTGTPAPDYNMKKKECGQMNGCTWKKIPGFNNSGNCSDECIAKTSEETCGAISGCNWNSTKCERNEDDNEQSELDKYFKQQENTKKAKAKHAADKRIADNKRAAAAAAAAAVAAAANVLTKDNREALKLKKKREDAAAKAAAAKAAAAAAAAAAKAEAAAAKCNFVPWGDTIRSCIDRCASIEDNDLWGGKACTDNKCYKICKKCTNNHCKWNDPKAADVSGGIVPLKQVIKAIPSENKTGIKVMWRSNENDIKSFLIYFYKTYDSNNSIFTQKIEKKNNNNYIEEIVENIEENQYYTIGICAINNDNKVGPISNLERVKTDGLTSYF